MLSIYLFVLFICAYAWILTPSTRIQPIAELSQTALDLSPVNQPVEPVTADPVETENTESQNAIDNFFETETTFQPSPIADIDTMTTRQLHKLCRELRDTRGIRIPRYKALSLTELRQAVSRELIRA